FASLLMPVFLKRYGGSVAFAIPGALMLIATAVFWAGRSRYVIVPPAERDPHSFLRVVRSAPPGAGPGTVLAARGLVLAIGALILMPQLGFVAAACLALVLVMGLGGAGAWMQLDRARAVHPAPAVDGVRSVLRVLVFFALVTPFWSLFDQKAS